MPHSHREADWFKICYTCTSSELVSQKTEGLLTSQLKKHGFEQLYDKPASSPPFCNLLFVKTKLQKIINAYLR